METKTLAIYFSDEDIMGYPFTKKEYFSRYKNIIMSLKRHDVKTFIVRGNSYTGNGIFSHGSYLENGKILPFNSSIQVDMIWNRDDKNTIPRIDDCPIINHPDLDEICVDKFKTFELFPDLSAKTALIHSFKEYKNLISTWKLDTNELIVLKKNFQTEGRGIYIKKIQDINESLYEDWSDILVQEFIDSSIGIPKITSGLHDLRVTVVNGRPINAFVRVPKDGSLLANVAQGGSGRSIELNELPDEALAIVEQILRKLNIYNPALFAIDLMHSKKGYRLVELNSRPGVQHRKWSSTYLRFNHALIEMLVMTLHPVK